MSYSKVSVVTITYNSTSYVKKSIESVLAQSFTDFEYLISDDCSTDNTWEIIQEYKDPRIRAWRNEKNIGEYPNRNKTLNLANGKYILWIDGDDILYPHGLEFIVKMLDAFPNSVMACVRPNWEYMVYPYELTPIETYLFDYLGSPVTTGSLANTLFKTSALKEESGFPINYIAADTYLKRKLAAKYNLLLVSTSVTWWRKTEGQASSLLRKTIKGINESHSLNMKLLLGEHCPLSGDDLKVAIDNTNSAYLKNITKLLLFRFKFVTFLKLFSSINLNFFKKISLIKRKIYNNYRGGGTTEAPLILDFNKNPYSQIH